MKKTMFALTFATTLAALLTACATEQTDLFKKKTTAVAKQSYAQAQTLTNEYYVTVRDDVKSFSNAQPDEMDGRIVVLETNPEGPALTVEDVLASSDLKADCIYTTPEVTSVLSLLDIRENISELGLKHVHIFFQSARLTPIQWAFHGDTQYQFRYRMVWFDANGKKIAADTSTRSYRSNPGSALRIVGYAPTEECVKFSLILMPYQEKAPDYEPEDDGIATNIANPADDSVKAEAPAEKEAPVATEAEKATVTSAPATEAPKTADDTKKLIEANK